MLVGYIIHNSVTEGGDNGWRGVQDGTAVSEQSLAPQRHSAFQTPQSSVCCWCRRSFEKSLKRSYTVQVNSERVGLVSFLFCVVLFCFVLIIYL